LKIEKYRKYYQPEREMAPSCFGFKYRMHPLAAAIARVQLRHLDEWNSIRRHNMTYITKAINEVMNEIGDFFEPPYEAPNTERVWLNYICQYYADKSGVPRERLIEAFKAEGIPATGGRTGYLPVYWNPIYEERSVWAKGYPFDAPYVSRRITYERGICPEAEKFWRRTVGLPVIHRRVSEDLLEEYVAAIVKVLKNINFLK
jgi:dTDP-4-amino-4,6-dideoxygalactose transaminase